MSLRYRPAPARPWPLGRGVGTPGAGRRRHQPSRPPTCG